MEHDAAPNAIVMQAGRHQFSPGATLHHPCVRSRRLLRCLAGRGQVRINRIRYSMVPGDFLFMSWRHSISYRADRAAPMLLSGIHIVPDFRPPGPDFAYGVPHADGQPQADSPYRRDAELPGLPPVLRGRFSSTSRLYHVAECTVEWFLAGAPDEKEARCLARLLLAELMRYARQAPQQAVPPSLSRVIEYVRANIDRKVSVSQLARVADCSPSTLTRMFRSALRCTPLAWAMREKMDVASRLLATTGLRVGEVGRRVGVDDPYYFSKLFRRARGTTALQYRRRSSLFSHP
jgi:AraC-like DNA-binding protein